MYCRVMRKSDLPIEEIRDALANALRAGKRRIVIEAPTGSGKSTQIPQMLLDGEFLGGAGQAVILQPRRLAARMLAKRVAEERGVELGGEVGYTIRLDDLTSAKTRIRFVTEGVLVRQMISRPKLEGVQAVICDEFHERHLYGDLTLGRILDLQEGARPDLILVVMSATLETEKLAQRIGAEVLRSEGRMYPVELEYLTQREDLSGSGVAEVAAREAERLIRQGKGDVLVFLPGAYEINRARRDLESRLGQREAVVLPLHGEMAPTDQDAALRRYDRPKVVVATNVAETSLTLDGVKAVVDCGMARMAKYDPAWAGDVACGKDQSCLGGTEGGAGWEDGARGSCAIGDGDGLVEASQGGRAGDPQIGLGGGFSGVGGGRGGAVEGLSLGRFAGGGFGEPGGAVISRPGSDGWGGWASDGNW